MNKVSKLSFLISFLFVIVLFSWRYVAGGWNNAMVVPLAIIFGFFFYGMIKEGRTILRFLSMRTAKHGMNMGLMILLAIAFLVIANVFAVRYEHKFDWTSNKINTLSDQSIKAARGLKSDVEFVLLYRKQVQGEENMQPHVRDIMDMYKGVTPKIKYVAYSALERPDMAEKYDFKQGSWGLFAVQGTQHVKIDQPNEQEITKALIKLGRDKKKIVYLTAGHGEHEYQERKPESISDLTEELATTFEVKSLSLIKEGNKVPADADIVAIIGPQQQFLEPELDALRSYARSGGHLFIALDPGLHQNLALLTKSFGVEFKNDYVVDPRATVKGAGNIAAIGNAFSTTNEITKSFKPGMMNIFLLASSLVKAPDAAASLHVEDLVKTDEGAFVTSKLEQQPKIEGKGPFTLAMSVTGKMPASADGKIPEGKDFSAVIFGDSDFVANTIFHDNLNRDLALNTFLALSSDKDLISIRPKAAKGQKLEVTGEKFAALVLFFIAITLALFVSSGFVWWRRRSA